MPAGTDTSRMTMMWLVLYMVRNPDIQAKMQEEIDSVVGKKESANSMVNKLLNLHLYFNTLNRLTLCCPRKQNLVAVQLHMPQRTAGSWKLVTVIIRTVACFYSMNDSQLHTDKFLQLSLLK